MKILIFGAGVLGSLYAARLQQAGQDISILARGRRLQEIHEQGLILKHAFSGVYTVAPLRVVEELNVCDQYDYIIVLVRNNQVEEALATIGRNIETLNILVMVNNVAGYEECIKAVGRERLMVGFAGAGGTWEDGVVKYALAPAFFQPTTLAELNGQKSERLVKLVQAFVEAGFPTTTSQNMDAWQKTHVAWVSPLAQAIYMARNEGLALGDSRNNLRLMIKAIRDSLIVLTKLHILLLPRSSGFGSCYQNHCSLRECGVGAKVSTSIHWYCSIVWLLEMRWTACARICRAVQVSRNFHTSAKYAAPASCHNPVEGLDNKNRGLLHHGKED